MARRDAGIDNGTDGQTDGQTDRQSATQYAAPSYGGGPHNNEKALGETQTLRAGRRKAEPKIFAPSHTHFPGAQDRQNLISWRWPLPAPTDPVW